VVHVNSTVVPTPPTSEAQDAAGVPDLGQARWWSRDRPRRLLLFLAEAIVAFVACLLLPVLVRHLDVNPMNRIGQVSGLAAIQLGFALAGIAALAGLLMGQWLRGGIFFEIAIRLSCAALAGLASGFVAAGAVVSLLGTPWPMFGLNGDTGRLVAWATSILHGHGDPTPLYPPLSLYGLAGLAKVFYAGNVAYAFKGMEILGTAVIGPLAYLAWRMLFRPMWALVIGVVPMMALIDSYKPYDAVVLILLPPVLGALLRAVRRSPGEDWPALLVRAAGLGLLLAVLFLTYSGWFVWSAGGVAAAVLLLFPWRSGRSGRLRGLAVAGTSAAAFLLVAGWYAVILLRSAGTPDRNFSFDVYTDPAYFSMWRTDMPGVVTQWPPPGEIGGVSVFTALLFVALGVTLWLGLRRSVVVATACIFASAWLMRLFFAARMYSTGEVELWIRTDNELLYCGLVFIGLAVYLLAARLVEARAALSRPPGGEGSGAGDRGLRPGLPLRGPAVIGAFAGLLMLAGSMGSSQSDRYMPADVPTYQIFTYVSHTVRMLNGRCPQYAPHGQCSKDGDQKWKSFIYVGPKP
jgi:hypothetical protein